MRRWLELLVATFLVRLLPPWRENLGKRLVKAPKLYLSDPGILHSRLDVARGVPRATAGDRRVVGGLRGARDRAGARRASGRPAVLGAAPTGAELELLAVRGPVRRGFEVKRTTTPTVTRSMRAATEYLRLTSVDVLHAGRETFPLAVGVRAVALHRVLDDVAPSR